MVYCPRQSKEAGRGLAKERIPVQSIRWFRGAARFAIVLALMLATLPALAADEATNALFDQAAAGLKTPAQAGLDTHAYALRLGDMAFVPSVAPALTPFDEQAALAPPAVNGTFESSDPSVVSVDDQGRMTGAGEGQATVTFHGPQGDESFLLTVSRDAPPELAKNMAYVARREFYKNKRGRMPKYNEYAKWYYGKKNEVGWCSVFTIWCANAAGVDPVKKKDAKEWPESDVLYLREGQVGNQYDGFFALDRFSGVPREGYLVIYADMSNGYRTTHVGIVVEALPLGEGKYRVTTVEGNMSNTVKSYCYVYDSNLDNHLVGTEKGLKLQWNMSEVPEEDRADPLPQYALHTDHWSVFGFCQSWQ